jgi:hypothetical protein
MALALVQTHNMPNYLTDPQIRCTADASGAGMYLVDRPGKPSITVRTFSQSRAEEVVRDHLAEAEALAAEQRVAESDEQLFPR